MSSDSRKALSKLTGLRGMNDCLPSDTAAWIYLEQVVSDLVQSYGYQQIRTPILEQTALFKRGIGEVTDIVEKEMYSFEDSLNGEHLTLRPEGTAAVVRSVIEHNLLYDGPKRLWYLGPMFRHERPQRGRYRQFHQLGIEALGFAGPDVDAEIILMAQRLWDELGITGVRLEINSLGQASERSQHKAALVDYLTTHQASLDEDSQRRLQTNPLRILDSKNPQMQELVENAPKLIDYLGQESLAHFEQLKKLLSANNIPFKINPRLVRGLDYYNLSVFEWVTDELGSQGTIAGGGRYDPLIGQLGGKEAPACGWAMGLERVIELMKSQDLLPQAQALCDVYIVHQYGESLERSLVIAESLRSSGINVVLHSSNDGQPTSFKAQMKKADNSGAHIALIIGEDEMKQNIVQMKNLRGESHQTPLAMSEVVDGVIQSLVSVS